MQVSLSPNINNYNNFKAQEPDKSTNVLSKVLNDKDKLEIQSKRVKSAVKRCIGVIALIDVIYFTMKHNFKHSRVARAAKKEEKLKQLIQPIVSHPLSAENLKKHGLEYIRTGSKSIRSGTN